MASGHRQAPPPIESPPRLQNPREDDQSSEEDALLGALKSRETSSTRGRRRTARWREIGLFTWALVATTAVIVLAVVLQHSEQTVRHDGGHGGSSRSGEGAGGSNGSSSDRKRNLIFMVSDGMGPSSLSLTRSWRQHSEQLAWNDTLALDAQLVGQSRTRSTDSWVTDSAAGATAFACGRKSYNGAISVLPHGFAPCGSVMEAAHRAGYATGLVVTTRVTDATPATFVSHVRSRALEDAIALQMVGATHPLGRVVDLVVGGGRCRFLPNSSEAGCRGDGVDVTELARKEGWSYVSSREEFDALSSAGAGAAELPLLALLASRDVPYEIDRRHVADEYASLEEMTKGALRMLDAATRDSDKGFFVMIEGSRIDHAGHANDPAAQVREVLAYDRAMAAVLEFIDESSTETLMVATSDHETGGLAVARQLQPEYPDYLWYPAVLANASHSASYASHRYHEYLDKLSLSPPDAELAAPRLKVFLANLASEALGIADVTADELDVLISYSELATYVFADMISRRAQIGWSTHGHTAADVNIYTSDPRAAAVLRGSHENTEVGAFLRSYLDLDEEVEKVTKELRKHMGGSGSGSGSSSTDGHVSPLSWASPPVLARERLVVQDQLSQSADAYMHRIRARLEGSAT